MKNLTKQFCHLIIELNRNPNISNCVSLHKYQHLSKEPKRDVKNDKPHSNYFASIFLLHAVHAHNKSIGNATDLVGKVYWYKMVRRRINEDSNIVWINENFRFVSRIWKLIFITFSSRKELYIVTRTNFSLALNSNSRNKLHTIVCNPTHPNFNTTDSFRQNFSFDSVEDI